MTTVYFDFLCPYAWRGLELLAALDISFEPRHYSLVQGNHADNAGLPRNAQVWKLAEQPFTNHAESLEQSLEAFLSNHAAQQQGEPSHLQFMLELLRLKHTDKKELNQATTLLAATNAHLDLPAFLAARADEPARRAELATDLATAGELGVFATPTIQLESGNIAYFRFANLPESRQAKQDLWQIYQTVLESDARIETIKRAKRP